MDKKNPKVIGIVGGMGPQSGLALFHNVLSHTDASTDQEHLPAILMSFPGSIEDRTMFLAGIEPNNPAFSIARIIGQLRSVGASVIGIACNTAHAPQIYNVIIEELSKMKCEVHLMNMPIEICRHIKENYPGARRIGLMTTNGTYKSGIYKNLLENLQYEVIIPDYKFQTDVIHRMIYDPSFGIKANSQHISDNVRDLAHEALAFFKRVQADIVILGCTELPLAITEKVVDDMVIVDSTSVFAKALVREASN